MLSSGRDTLDMILQVAFVRNSAPAVELQITDDTHDRILRERGWTRSNSDQAHFLLCCRPMRVTITSDLPNFPGFAIIRGAR